MRCYTTKPWWRSRGDLPLRYNRFGVILKDSQPFRLNMKGLSAELRPRSHSLVVRATGNRVGLSLGSSNLPLGATSFHMLPYQSEYRDNFQKATKPVFALEIIVPLIHNIESSTPPTEVQTTEMTQRESAHHCAWRR